MNLYFYQLREDLQENLLSMLPELSRFPALTIAELEDLSQSEKDEIANILYKHTEGQTFYQYELSDKEKDNFANAFYGSVFWPFDLRDEDSGSPWGYPDSYDLEIPLKDETVEMCGKDYAKEKFPELIILAKEELENLIDYEPENSRIEDLSDSIKVAVNGFKSW